MRMGNSQINVNPCTPSEERANWAQVSQNFLSIFTTIDSGTFTDSFKVGMDATDVTPTYAGPDFLFAKILNQGTYDSGSHQLVYGEIYDDSGVLKLNLFTLAAAETGTDNKKVLVSATDTTDEYLYASMKDAGTYDSGTDALVLAAIADGGANEKLRQFVRVNTSFLSKFWNIITIVGGSWDSGTNTLSLEAAYRMIRGEVVSDVTADDASFAIDNIIPLENGKDPRSNTTDPTEQVTVYNIQKEAFQDNAPITAVYRASNSHWEVLAVERFRSVRGEYVSGTSTLTIDHIVVLGSGVDPRSDPTSTSETLSVSNIHNDVYSAGDTVIADYNSKDGVWESRPTIANAAEHRYGRVVVAIPGADSILTADWGVAVNAVSVLDNDTGEEVDPENPITVQNRTSQPYAVDCMVELRGSLVVNGDCFPQPIEFWEPA